jgi:hypothetical protein
MTAAASSRTIITHFLAFRDPIVTAGSYCRGIDYIAFVAATTLCLVHIEARRQYPSDTSGASVLQSLYHQRLSDRGLLERIQDATDEMARVNGDIVAKKITRIMRPLLEIEEKSATGQLYQASVSPTTEGQGPRGCLDVDGFADVLRIEIPHFGTITIRQHPRLVSGTEAIDNELSFTRQQPFGGAKHPGIPGAPGADWENESRSLSQPVMQQMAAWGPMDQMGAVGDKNDATPLVSGLTMEADDDWALQGVDMALFNSIAHFD